jgi:hypothetical protein
MRSPARLLLPLAALGACALAACTPPAGLECPTARMPGADGAPVETTRDIAAYGARFADGYGGSTIPEAIAAVRKAYPAATTEEVRTFLVAAYCPVARASAPGKSDQKDNLEQFEMALVANLTTTS